MAAQGRNCGPAIWTGIFQFCAALTGVCLLHQIRLDRYGRTVDVRAVEPAVSQGGKRKCAYLYEVGGQTYRNVNVCVKPTPRIDYLPSDPLESRLHGRREGTVATCGLGFFAFVAILAENPKFWRR